MKYNTKMLIYNEQTVTVISKLMVILKSFQEPFVICHCLQMLHNSSPIEQGGMGKAHKHFS
jgi:hypothetical protein